MSDHVHECFQIQRKDSSRLCQMLEGCFSIVFTLVFLLLLVLLYSYIPFIRDELFVRWLPYLFVSTFISVMAECSVMVLGRRFFLTHAFFLVRDTANLISTMALYDIFPFHLDALRFLGNPDLLVRILLFLGIIGSGIGMIVNLRKTGMSLLGFEEHVRK